MRFVTGVSMSARERGILSDRHPQLSARVFLHDRVDHFRIDGLACPELIDDSRHLRMMEQQDAFRPSCPISYFPLAIAGHLLQPGDKIGIRGLRLDPKRQRC
jgi:hypothetical protein